MIDQVNKSEELDTDSAAVFAAALSLWKACHEAEESDPSLNLSDSFNGIDQMMREVMRIAELFERWACLHVVFEGLEAVWPYRLNDDFGDACLMLIQPAALVGFDDRDCLRVALELRLPIRLHDGIRVPIDVHIKNPIPDSEFRQFRIQTVRDHREDGDVHPFWIGEEPFDDEFTAPYFALYGVDINGLSEHIADRRTYAEITTLAHKILPDIRFPDFPTRA